MLTGIPISFLQVIPLINFTDYINKLSCKQDDKEGFSMDLAKFLVANNWFGVKITIENGCIMVDDKGFNMLVKRVDSFCSNYSDTSGKAVYLLQLLHKDYPKTEALLLKYSKHAKLNEETVAYVADFLLYNLLDEIVECVDKEIEDLLDAAYNTLAKVYGDILVDFINWVKTNTKTQYQCLYSMNSYSTKEENSEAYDKHSYLKILYHLYNAEYIEANDMYIRAANSKNYVDTWLFLALHFLCALRRTDLIRIPHPTLIKSPAETLADVENGVFSDDDARYILSTVIWRLDALMLVPNKTKGTSGVPSIKVHIPTSVEVHIGTLLAVAEAHFQLNETDKEKPLIRIISRYEQINRYMGEEIGELFLDANFHSRQANKSYLQMIFLLTDEILGINDEFSVKGYNLAALARSHKSSYGDFAKTTSIYLQDAKMNGYTPEFVARELFERGVLSMIPSMLLKMVIGEGDYNKLPVGKQTQLIKALNMTPYEIEQSVALMQANIGNSLSIAQKLYNGAEKEEILTILHRIGNGEAVSKCDGCLCLLTAMGKACPYLDNHNCHSCEYEISTKTTMFLMVHESKRLMAMYKQTNNTVEKNRLKALAKDIVIPSINEMLTVMEETYGSKSIVPLEHIIKETK